MNIVRIKTADLIGAQLDFAVALALGLKIEWHRSNICPGLHPMVADGSGIVRGPFHYSGDWKHGGPIIERERISLDAWERESGLWYAQVENPDPDAFATGPTPLIAAMRAFVASKFGDEVEVPEVSA